MNRLYEFQKKCAEDIVLGFGKYRKVLFVAPTGSGKTVVAVNIAKRLNPIGGVLVIAHRRELLDQFQLAAHKAELHCDYSTIQSAHKVSKSYGLIIVDEAHHIVTKSYSRLLKRFPSAFLFGMTATPQRLDGKPIKNVFETVVEAPGVASLQQMGFLVKAQEYSVGKKLDLRAIKKVAGDYNLKELGMKVQKTILFSDVFREYRLKGEDRQALVYCVDVKHAKDVAAQFQDRGISASSIDGLTPKEERQWIMDEFKSGQLRVLTNCMLYTEGVDIPDIGCIIMLRPTLSLALYLQMAGRGLRAGRGKMDCVILDHANNHAVHGTVNADREWRYVTRERVVGGATEMNPFPSMIREIIWMDGYNLIKTQTTPQLLTGAFV